MAELLRLESTRLYGSNGSGCIWGLFRLFDSYHRREKKTMLSYRRLGGRQYNMGDDILMENETGEEDTVANEGANNIAENKANNMTKSSGKRRILKFIGKKLLKRQKHKGKMPHSSSQLMRTISVHHSESSDHITPCELSQMTSDTESETIALDLDDTDSLALSEHESLVINGIQGSVEGKPKALVGAFNATGYDIDCLPHKLDELGNHLLDEHIILKEKLFEARDALLKYKDSDPKTMTVEFSLLSKIFLDTLHLFNTNREALYSVCKGQNSFMASDMQALTRPAKARPLNRSVSLTGLEFSGNAAGILIRSRKRIEFDGFIDHGSESESVDFQPKAFGAVPDIEVFPGSHELRKQGETKTVLSRLRDLKQRLKSVIVENKHEQHRISMDRILDKVPSGHKLQEDEEDSKFHLKVGPVSRGGQGFTANRMASGSSTGKFAHNGVQRSHSLTESLDRYSQLLDSISSNEARKAPERLNSIREDSGLLQGKLLKTHRRLPSNPEFLNSYCFIKDVQSEVHIACQSLKKPTMELHDSNLASTSDKLTKDSIIEPAFEEIAFEQEGSLESNIVANTIKPNEQDKFVTTTIETTITETEGHEGQLGSINECLPITPFQFSEILEEKNVLLDEQVSHIEDEPIVKPESASPTSVLDLDVEEPVSPLKFTVMEDADSQQLHEYHEEQLPCSEAQKVEDINEINTAELSKLSSYEETSTTIDDQANFSFAHVDEKDASIFKYVKHILSKTGYEALLCETEDSSIEAEITHHMLCTMPSEEQLMYDLINEVLFEIYEYSAAPSSWLSRFHSKIRSMPTGSHLLDEVWAKITWHLSSPQGLDAMVDKILARNFTKTDDWMNLYRDVECFGLLLEQLILDDLVDEVILDIDDY